MLGTGVDNKIPHLKPSGDDGIPGYVSSVLSDIALAKSEASANEGPGVLSATNPC